MRLTLRAGISTLSPRLIEPERMVPVITVPWPLMEKQWSTDMRKGPEGSLVGMEIWDLRSWKRDAAATVRQGAEQVVWSCGQMAFTKATKVPPGWEDCPGKLARGSNLLPNCAPSFCWAPAPSAQLPQPS